VCCWSEHTVDLQDVKYTAEVNTLYTVQFTVLMENIFHNSSARLDIPGRYDTCGSKSC